MKPFQFVVLLALSACVSTHHGKPAVLESGTLLVSCGDNWQARELYFQLVSCTFENKSNEWMAVKVTSAEILQAYSPSLISSPEEIQNMLLAKEGMDQDKLHNEQVAVAGVMLLGAGLLMAADSNIGKAGAAAALGAVSYGATRQVAREHSKLQYGDPVSYGPTHVLGTPFRLGPGLYLRRHLVVQTSQKNSAATAFRFCLNVDKQNRCVDLALQNVRRL